MTPQHINILSRRRFLDRSLKTGLALALSTLTDIPLVVKRALAEGSIGRNGKKILFIWLRGANDGLNSVIPIRDPAYAPSRETLAINADAVDYSQLGACDFPLSASDAASPDFPTYHYPNAIRLGNGFAALHPSLKFLAPVYNAGQLALIHRVGYPKQSRSHFDSQRYWENGTPNNNLVSDGIFYRAIIESGLAGTSPLTGVTVQSALPLILRGSEAAMTNLTDPNRYALLGVPANANGLAKATRAIAEANGYPFPAKLNRDLLQLQYQNLANTLDVFAGIDFDEDPGPGGYGNHYRDNEITDGDTNWAANTPNPNPNDSHRGYYLFPTTAAKNGGWQRPDGSTTADKYVVDPGHHSFFSRLKAAALILNKTDAIIAGTELNGFDTHRAQGKLTGTHPNLLRAIGWSLYALQKYFTLYADRATWNDIVVVTLSEFGRTTVENSDLGTDHAEAGLMFVAGGAVRGFSPGVRSGVINCHPADPIPWLDGSAGSMFGVSGRYLKRTADYRSVLGEIIRKHLGATPGQVERIIPGYADPREKLLAGGVSEIDSTPIRGELGIL